jgi:hypothetical protein
MLGPLPFQKVRQAVDPVKSSHFCIWQTYDSDNGKHELSHNQDQLYRAATVMYGIYTYNVRLARRINNQALLATAQDNRLTSAMPTPLKREQPRNILLDDTPHCVKP